MCRERPERRGVSLLEVLISIFVLAIGLLALAALIPVGKYQAKQGEIADRSAAVGRAAMREVMVRRMLDRKQWSVEAPPQLRLAWLPTSLSQNYDYFSQYALIDPVFVAANGSGSFAGWMPRMTLWSGPVASACQTPLSAEAADLIFVSRDDRVCDVSQDAESRTEVPGIVGDYSWALMVSPAAAEGEPYWYQYDTSVSPPIYKLQLPPDRLRPVVSIVVFYKRDLAPDAEQVVNVTQFSGAGIGGGDVTLTAPNTTIGAKAFATLKIGHWILLHGVNLKAGPVQSGHYVQWYRVVAVTGDGDSTREVTLTGPDWDTGVYPAGSTEALLIPRVVGIYEKAVQRGQ